MVASESDADVIFPQICLVLAALYFNTFIIYIPAFVSLKSPAVNS